MNSPELASKRVVIWLTLIRSAFLSRFGVKFAVIDGFMNVSNRRGEHC